MEKKSHDNTHWNYYLALEQDLEVISRYVEFNESNFDTYSIAISHLLIASASETDVLLQQLCKLLAPEKKVINIRDYKKVLAEHKPFGFSDRVLCPRYNLAFTPWQEMATGESPNWWRSYNKVKHERGSYFHMANLSNSLNAMAALYMLNVNLKYISWYKHCEETSEKFIPPELRDTINHLNPNSRLFKFDDLFLYINEGVYR